MQYEFLSALEKAAQNYFHPLLQRLHFVSRQDDLECSPLPSHQTADAGVSGVVGAQMLDTLKYAELFWDEA